jgi:hypothetical protein
MDETNNSKSTVKSSLVVKAKHSFEYFIWQWEGASLNSYFRIDIIGKKEYFLTEHLLLQDPRAHVA